MSQQTAGWDVIPFESSKTVKPSLFWKLGNKLGNIFVSAKHKAKSKYVEVTKGINQRIAEEDEMRALELQMCLDEQAAEYEQEISRIKRKMFFLDFVGCHYCLCMWYGCRFWYSALFNLI